MTETDILTVGRITGVYGVKGWVRVYSDTDPREGIVDYKTWYLKHPALNRGEWFRVALVQGRRQGKTVIASLEAYHDRTLAETLVDAEIGISEDQLRPLAENEYYWRDLIGLRVINQQEKWLGEVKELLATGANDVLVVAGKERELLIPWTPGHAVVRVDLDHNTLVVDWDEDYL